ncbi:MAG: 4-(cytidine 5'-diphospho)-2-C-methyl-D-erythritol kinase [Acidobacteria bacterium]|nr:4-(cytidine 5'-diphospho)-2-C-methyl-D-erythritol kinase [Acidobacteriota bacterium]
MPTLTGRAPAKINLALKILNRHPDGFHELRTVLQTISLADRLKVTYRPRARNAVHLVCDRPELAGDDNLAAIAARRLIEAGSRRGTVEIELNKRIPVGAGLGGGSSDAAAVLLALARMLRPAPPPALLFTVAAGLGSDVPFFLVGGRCVGLGRGEEVYPLPDIPRQWLLVLAPDRPISTVHAYRDLDRARRTRLTVAASRNIISGFCSGISAPQETGTHSTTEAPPNQFVNDFEAVTFQRFPELGRWKDRLVRAGASGAMLSGSGSAVFGLFPIRASAVAASRAFDTFPGKVLIACTIGRRACRAVWGTERGGA